ncbi:MAG: type II TA system antitoxin MqsA family protein [Gemmatimonadales bacterium]|jgi:putative zinc finger/helix-turn-helix YgiT family protein
MPCPFCGAKAVRVTSATRTVNAGDGARLTYRERLSHCARCGEEFFTHEQSLAASRSRAGVLRTHEGLLAPEEIRSIRGRYGVSQAELERMLGLGAKTVVRWERGTVRQSQAADLLLRIVAEDRRHAEKLAAGAGVTLAAARTVHRKALAKR